MHIPMLLRLYKPILKTPEQAALYGINETKRLEYIEDVVANMIYNLGDMSNYGSSIVLPTGSIGWKILLYLMIPFGLV